MFIDRPVFHQKVYIFLLVALGASLPLFFRLSNYITILLVLNWLIAGNFRQVKANFSNNKLYIAIVSLFFAFVLGLIHTSDLSEGLKDIEHKISLLVVPLVVFTSGDISKKTLHKILIAFAGATLLACSVALCISIYKYINGADSSTFFYHQLANNARMHAVYLSCYLAFTFFIVLHYIIAIAHRKLATLLLLSIEVYIVAMLILLSSKTILAAFIVAIIVFAILRLGTGKKLWYGLAASVLVSMALVLALSNTSYTSSRFEQVIDTKFEVLNQSNFRYDTEFSGLSLRLLFWKFAYLINEREGTHLFGVGTGDSKGKLNEIYHEYNLYLGNPNIEGDKGYLNYNTHSQFVETYLKIGIAGFLLLTVLFIYLLYFSVKHRYTLFTVFLLIFIAFNITETTLEVNKGIAFYSFFVSVFLNATRSNLQYIKSPHSN